MTTERELHVVVASELYEKRDEFSVRPVTVTMSEPSETGEITMLFTAHPRLWMVNVPLPGPGGNATNVVRSGGPDHALSMVASEFGVSTTRLRDWGTRVTEIKLQGDYEVIK